MNPAPTRPNFLIIGAAKCATTALANMLAQHPQAAIVQGKEPHFFSMDQVYGRGWSWYQTLYGHCHDQKAIGDASTSYSRVRYHPQVIPRIKAHIPDTRIIYMVRHPIERMVSAYMEWLGSPGSGNVFSSINEAVRRQPMIVDSSRYWEVFNLYREHFGEDRIKVLWFEDFARDNGVVFSEVCRFLDIDESVTVQLPKEKQNSRENALQRARQLGRENIQINTEWEMETLQWVRSQIADDNRRFLEYFGRAPDLWA